MVIVLLLTVISSVICLFGNDPIYVAGAAGVLSACLVTIVGGIAVRDYVDRNPWKTPSRKALRRAPVFS